MTRQMGKSLRFTGRVLGWFIAWVVIAGAATALAVLVVKYAPRWLSDATGLDPAQASAERGRVRTALLAVLAGALAAIGAVYTARTFALNRLGQATEQYTRAVEQLGSKKVDVRIGGLYALERLAKSSSRDHHTIMNVLAAYVRAHAHWSVEPGAADASDPPPAEIDIQTVIAILGRRNGEPERRGHLIAFDLSSTNLRGVRADNLRLQGARLSFARLDDAIFPDADLRGANLIATHFTDAQLPGANLQGVNFGSARLARADLSNSHLERADLSRAIGLGTAVLNGARYDSDTGWPDHFDPLAAGAIPTRGWVRLPKKPSGTSF
jgi:Pentapeptide repeats (8 copies)